MQHYPAAWGHYDVCKSQIYSDEGLTWDYMACQPETADMTQYLKVMLDPPNITCGNPPETYCALVSTRMRPVVVNVFLSSIVPLCYQIILYINSKSENNWVTTLSTV